MNKIIIAYKPALIMLLSLSCFSGIAFAQSKEEGIRAIDVEQYEKAKGIFSKLIKENPTEGSNYYFLGDAYFKSDQEDSARILFNKGLLLNNGTYNYIGLGEIDLANNNTSSAKQNFEKAAIAYSKEASVFLYIGAAYLYADKKDLTEAMNYLNKAKALDSKNPEILCAIADVYLEQNNGTQAASFYDQALNYNAKFVKAYVRLGRLFTRALNYNESKSNFDKAIALDPSYPPIYRDLGELEFRFKHYEKAIESYQKFVDLTDNSINTQVRYASFLFLNKEYKKSYDAINGLLTKDTTHVIMYRLLGYSCYELKLYPEGLSAMQKFFKNAEAKRYISSDYAYLGKLQCKNKMDSLGILNIKKAIELSPEDPDLLGDLAEAYTASKKYNDAAATYEAKFIIKKPTPNDYYAYGRACMYGNQLVKADSAFAQVNRALPTFIPVWSFRAAINSNLDPDGSQGLAKPFYDKVVELGEADAVKNKKDLIKAYEYLGDYYFEKDKTVSRSYFQKLKDIDPDNVKATEFLKQIK